jgi:tetratricopeptide (TPR) repeat protein
MRRPLALAAFLALFAPSTTYADWLSLRSDHFQVIGNVGEGDLRNVALKFEQFRDVISQLNPAILGEGTAPPVVILVFKDKDTYTPFMPVTNGTVVPVGGFFQPSEAVNYITLTLETADQGLGVVFHEFSHLLLRGVFADAPLWFNEGLAEYYSTFEVPSSRRANIGKPDENHLRLLRSRSLPFARFFAIDRKSPEYTKDTIGRNLLYAQAWAIVHHAFHGESKRRDQLFAFVTKLADGGPTEQSFRAAYGIELRDLETEMQSYVQQLSHRYTIFEFREDLVRRIESRATKISEAEADAWLGDLLSHMNRDDEATARLEKALAANKDLALAHSSLGALQIRAGKTAEGMAHLKEAQALGTANEVAYFLYAYELASQREPDGLQQASQALQRAIALRPGYTEAKLLLGYVYLGLGEYTSARDLLLPVVRAERTNHRAALRLGEALLALNDIAGARGVLGPVIARTTDEAEKDRARTLLARSTELQKQRDALAEAPASRPPAGDDPNTKASNKVIPVFRTLGEGERRATGVFEAVECGPKGIVFVVRTAESRLRARAARFEDVEFLTYRTLASPSVSCGAQVPAMEVYLTWRPPPGSNEATEGTAVAIEILPAR